LAPRRLPRDLDADDLIRGLACLEYEPVRQSGSHVRIRTFRDGEHHETIPRHAPLKVGTLNRILRNIADHHNMTREALLDLLDL
jgi:predicted RNA binding protein YcfA (HicA-like mRNA interferase family)